MAIKSYFFNAVQSGGVYDRVYNADDVTSYLDLLVGNGVFPTPSTMLQVRANSGMTVIVGAGAGWINGCKIVNTADMTLTVDQSDAVLNRIDSVIFYADYTAREMGIEIKKGTAANTPTAPAMTRTSSRYEMRLANIYVGKQVTAIYAADITDTRGGSDCGYVAGLIQQMDTSTLFDQFTDAFETWFTDAQAAYTSKVLSESAYTETLSGSYTANSNFKALTTAFPTYNHSTDLIDVYLNGLRLTPSEFSITNSSPYNLRFPINIAAGNEINVIMLKNAIA